MNGVALLLAVASLLLGWALHRQQMREHAEFEEFRKEVRLAGLCAALDDTGDQVFGTVFPPKEWTR